MSTTPVIQYLQLDPQYDPVFDSTAALTNLDAVTQAIGTRLRLFLGEWWENANLGLPVFQQILGQLGSQQGINAMTLTIQENIAGAPYVTSVQDIQVTFTNGQLSVTALAQTQFGTATLSTVGSTNAVLET